MLKEPIVDITFMNFIMFILNGAEYDIRFTKKHLVFHYEEENSIYCQFGYPYHDNLINPLRSQALLKVWEENGNDIGPNFGSVMKSVVQFWNKFFEKFTSTRDFAILDGLRDHNCDASELENLYCMYTIPYIWRKNEWRLLQVRFPNQTDSNDMVNFIDTVEYDSSKITAQEHTATMWYAKLFGMIWYQQKNEINHEDMHPYAYSYNNMKIKSSTQLQYTNVLYVLNTKRKDA